METSRNSYSNIIKATILFGGVNLFQIVIAIIRSKFIAVLLGPTGMGIAGLITSTTELISTFTGFGLRTSGVQGVAKAYNSGDELNKNTIISVLKKLVLLTGITGTALAFIFSSHLSKWAFGNNDYSLSFKIVSVILFFNQVNIGQIVLLQGTFQYKYIAKSTLLGSILGLFFTIPLYYYWKTDGIVPAIVISSFIQLLLSWYFSKKVPYKKVDLPIKQMFYHGKSMLTLGIVIALIGFVAQGKEYLLRVVISNYGSIADVGLFNAGIAITSTYVGILFSAMGTDYAPRLAAIAGNDKELTQVINKQAIFFVTILSPIIVSFILFIKQIVVVLYSNEFIEIYGMIEWVILGMLFRAISWSISFSFVARGDSKIFFWHELFANCYSLIFSVIGYILIGLTGVGIAFLITYLFYSIQMYYLSRIKFDFSFDANLVKAFVIQSILLSSCFLILKMLGDSLHRYTVGFVLLLLSVLFMLNELDKMIGLKLVMKNLSDKITRAK
ncbi:MAG: oligosaccharide flippase family protein [Spirochaetes bacterium]|nr:oligosaccharide flippase family protein [Spirochaetota bacterium]